MKENTDANVNEDTEDEFQMPFIKKQKVSIPPTNSIEGDQPSAGNCQAVEDETEDEEDEDDNEVHT